MWKGRFKKDLSEEAVKFSSSISFDRRLYLYDIEGSVAYAEALFKAGMLSEVELKQIVDGLNSVKKDISEGIAKFNDRLEDVHMNIEKMLTDRIGDVGKKLHTGRSRNEQVLVDVKLYLKDRINEIEKELSLLCGVFIDISERYIGKVMPSYTHMRPAQPVLFSHYFMSFFWMFYRDFKRLRQIEDAVDVLPLGVGAIAGNTFGIDRKFLMKRLGFKEISENSIDTVEDRDFIVEFLFWAALFGAHVSKLAEDIIIFSSPSFSFFTIDDAYSTGSSMMPQKKNPDMFELSRGKASRLYGNLFAILSLIKGLPSGYNRDLQEDKEPLFDTVNTVSSILGVLVPMLQTMRFNWESMEYACELGYIVATDVADYLVRKGIPFRDAHHIVGNVVKYCIDKGKKFKELSMEEWKNFHPAFSEEIFQYLSFDSAVNRRNSYGGTSEKEVRRQIEKAKKLLKSV